MFTSLMSLTMTATRKPLVVVEEVVKEGRLACAGKTGQYWYRKPTF